MTHFRRKQKKSGTRLGEPPVLSLQSLVCSLENQFGVFHCDDVVASRFSRCDCGSCTKRFFNLFNNVKKKKKKSRVKIFQCISVKPNQGLITGCSSKQGVDPGAGVSVQRVSEVKELVQVDGRGTEEIVVDLFLFFRPRVLQEGCGEEGLLVKV